MQDQNNRQHKDNSRRAVSTFSYVVSAAEYNSHKHNIKNKQKKRKNTYTHEGENH